MAKKTKILSLEAAKFIKNWDWEALFSLSINDLESLKPEIRKRARGNETDPIAQCFKGKEISINDSAYINSLNCRFSAFACNGKYKEAKEILSEIIHISENY